ncbi:MAG: response regulator [Phycisphaerae bacterium]|nr:response regulator [Phycisphaerae bacterium]
MSEIPVVIADDDPDLVRLLGKHLGKAGYTVLKCGNGKEAFDLVAEHKAVLLLADWEMPGLTGVELCRRIRESQLDNAVYIILLTANGRQDHLVAGLESGADDYLVKPAHPAELLARVRAGERVLRLWLQKEQRLEELKESQQMLSDSEKRLQTILDTIQAGIMVIDAESHRIVDANPAAVAMIEAPKEQIIGRVCHDCICPAEVGRCPITDLGQEVDNSERVLVKADGKTVAILKTVVPVMLNGHKYLLDSFVDISKRKEAEEKLNESNAMMVEALEREKHLSRKLEITMEELETAQRQLVDASRQAGMAEVATGVLHNVGNVLNSVNVSAHLLVNTIGQSKVAGLSKAVALMNEHSADLGGFLTTDSKGRKLPGYLSQLAGHLVDERSTLLEELKLLTRDVEHIKTIVNQQQDYATMSGMIESFFVAEVVDDALSMGNAVFARHGIEVIRHYDEVPRVSGDRQKLLQILVNLVRNANHSLRDGSTSGRCLTARVTKHGEDRLRIEVRDTGVGIPQENMGRIFTHGFTTKKNGHGFGLHNSALAAREMGGSLTAHSDGPNRGATFTLELPLHAVEATKHAYGTVK